MKFKIPLLIALLFATIPFVHADEKKDEPSVTVQAGKDGFLIKSSDQKFSLKIGGYLHADSRFLLSDDSNAGIDTFQLSRARLVFDGTFYKYLNFRFMPDWGVGTSVIQDAYLEWTIFQRQKFVWGSTKRHLV